jgi:hypothetical protein
MNDSKGYPLAKNTNIVVAVVAIVAVVTIIAVAVKE